MDSKKKLQLASLTAGIISLTLLIFDLSVPVAALGIIFAIMSRDEGPIEGHGQAGLITSIIGLVFGLIFAIFSFYLMFSGTYDKIMKQLEETYTNNSSDSSESLKDWLVQHGYTSSDTQTEAA